MAVAKNNTIINDSFLLESQLANQLYHNYAAGLPIIDYHNHLSAKDIAQNRNFKTITDIWLKGDHYKWRAMRALGVSEKFISGKSNDEQKFLAWANALPQTLRNPLFHWSVMELKNTFGIDAYLNEQNALSIYKNTNKQLQKKALSTKGILTHYKVELVGTTDDPCDDLKYHQKIAKEKFPIKVLPTFRPDKIFNIRDQVAFKNYVKQLEQASQLKINSIDTLLAALKKRVDYFHEHDCKIADHGLIHLPTNLNRTTELDAAFFAFLQNKKASDFEQADQFVGVVLVALSKLYCKYGWVQQFHLGAIRNNNTHLQEQIGFDAGADSMGDYPQAVNLSNFLNTLEKTGQLAKTILYNSNSADNEVFATMCGNFSEAGVKGKVQFGSGWWFLDQKDGIEKQLNALSTMGVLSSFIGMTTDSRSFLSYSRHEYFRRILCNLLAKEMEAGLLPNDEVWVGKIIQDICYYNAKKYFNV